MQSRQIKEKNPSGSRRKGWLLDLTFAPICFIAVNMALSVSWILSVTAPVCNVPSHFTLHVRQQTTPTDGVCSLVCQWLPCIDILVLPQGFFVGLHLWIACFLPHVNFVPYTFGCVYLWVVVRIFSNKSNIYCPTSPNLKKEELEYRDFKRDLVVIIMDLSYSGFRQ